MNPREYETMAALEGEHWWYRGLRDALLRILRSPCCALPEHPRILDAGCGTGANLRMLRDEFAPSYLAGFDLAAPAVEAARKLVPEAEITQDDLCAPRFATGELDLVTSCDVIYVPGYAQARDGLRRIVSLLKPGGLFVVNLPAYRWLTSEHDVAIHTSERYTAGAVRRMFADLDLTVVLLTYRMFLLFPLVVLARLPTMFGRVPDAQAARSDVRLPSRPVNSFLAGVLRCENRALRAGVRFPWGSSVFAVGCRTKGATDANGGSDPGDAVRSAGRGACKRAGAAE